MNNAPVPSDAVARVALALDVDPESVRADTPLSSLGWAGSAGEWAVVSDHLGFPISTDPGEVATIGDLVAIVESARRRSLDATN